MKTFSSIIITLIIIISSLVIWIYDGQEILIESRESKTVSNEAVFNKIKWVSYKNEPKGEDKDIWMMNQSHHGKTAQKSGWDRLAIVVDKSNNPFRVKFYQFKAGPLTWSEKMKETPYKVSCFMCHPNGPRAIRPNYDSTEVPINAKTKLKIFLWNLKIKSYGRVLVHESYKMQNDKRVPPFRWKSSYENETLKVGKCIMCHKEDGLFARGSLTRQNVPTIEFMLESGEMPPLGLSLSEKEKMKLKDFLKGF